MAGVKLGELLTLAEAGVDEAIEFELSGYGLLNISKSMQDKFIEHLQSIKEELVTFEQDRTQKELNLDFRTFFNYKED